MILGTLKPAINPVHLQKWYFSLSGKTKKKKWTDHWLKQVFQFHPLPTTPVVSTG